MISDFRRIYYAYEILPFVMLKITVYFKISISSWHPE